MTTDPRHIYIGTTERGEEVRRRARSILLGTDREHPDIWTDERINEVWDDEFRARLRSDQDCVVVGWGPPGSGKSNCMLNLAHRIDPTFNSDTLAERVAFTAEQVPDLYDVTPRYGACVIDEAASAGLLAMDSPFGVQRDLVELINIIRARNVWLGVVIPDPAELAKSFRARRADYRVEVVQVDDERREGWVGRRVRGRKYYMDDGRWLGFDDEKIANPITWTNWRTSSDPELRKMWEVYYPLKMKNLSNVVAKVRAAMTKRAERREKGRMVA